MMPMKTYHLRAMEPRDLHCVLSWRNHADVRRCMLTQHEITLPEHEAWFTRKSADPSARLLVLDVAGEPQGFVQFTGAYEGGAADWGFYSAPGAVKGTGTKLGQLALQFAFQSIGLHKVCGQALDFNEGSIRFHQSLGFHEEGRLREQHRIQGSYHDLFCFGLLSQEWRETRVEVERT